MNVNAPAFVPSGTSATPVDPQKANGSQIHDHNKNLPKKHHSNQRNKKRIQNEDAKSKATSATSSRQMHPPRSRTDAAARATSHGDKRQPKEHRDRLSSEQQPNMSLVEVAQSTGGATDKKGRVSLNHLLNFSFPERQSRQQSYTSRKSKTAVYQPYNKERYVNANFRFLVNPRGDYMINLADPDSNFDWDNIEQVSVRILHPYAVTSQRECEGQMSSKTISEGDKIDMRLIQRASDSTLSFPLSDSWPVPEDVIRNYMKPSAPLLPWHFSPNAMQFARFMLASPEYIEAELSRDMLELTDALVDAKSWGSSDEIPFLDSAIHELEEKMEMTKQQHTVGIQFAMQTSTMLFDAVAKKVQTKGKAPETKAVADKEQITETEEAPEAYLQHHLRRAGEGLYHKDVKVPTVRSNGDGRKGLTPVADYYFFQSADGQHIYLHPLDIKILKHEFGDYCHFPRELQVVATGIEESTVTEELRKKFKYLGHVPLACDITFLEIDLKSLVSGATLKAFENELRQRVKQRQDRIKREEKANKAVEARQRKQQRMRSKQQPAMDSRDPFFQINRPMTVEENEEMLARVINLSSVEAENSGGPKTVWGTRAVPASGLPETQANGNNSEEWADHIIVKTKGKKKRNKN
ncbi:hypothetical protein DFQ30_010096 [Apophysomyces sp. BC1015]|nr:hypothetical protein DFQ30_010096 [Apophysomyces sp. BC1015]